MGGGGRYESAMFWLAFGTAAAVIGLALMTIGVTRTAPGANLMTSGWFDGGLGVLAIGALLLLFALGLYLARRRRHPADEQGSGGPADLQNRNDSAEAEAVKGYYAEREQLIKLWERDQDRRKPGAGSKRSGDSS